MNDDETGLNPNPHRPLSIFRDSSNASAGGMKGREWRTVANQGTPGMESRRGEAVREADGGRMIVVERKEDRFKRHFFTRCASE